MHLTISDDFETEEAFNFTFVHYFNVMRELSDDSVARMDRRTSDKDIIDINCKDDVVSFSDVDACV